MKTKQIIKGIFYPVSSSLIDVELFKFSIWVVIVGYFTFLESSSFPLRASKKLNCLRFEGSSAKKQERKSRSRNERKILRTQMKRRAKKSSRNPIHTHTTNNRAVSDFHSLFHPLPNLFSFPLPFGLLFFSFLCVPCIVIIRKKILDGKETLFGSFISS